ncbi:protein xylosyltransferase [Aureococcus anophagefferens]|nr:protein xylosyltransferase [Aureococcus anophagefferens]
MRALRGLLCCLACVNAESGCDVLARLAKDEPVLAVAFATASYASLAANWALSAARVGLPHALLELEGPAGASGVPDAVAVASISPAAAHAFAENRGGGLSGLWLARALALEAILAPACLQSDVLVLHSDVDVVFLGDVAGPLLLERVVALTARLGDDQLALNHALDDLGFGGGEVGDGAPLLDAPSFPVGGCDRWLEVAAALEHGAAPRVLHPNCVDKAGGSKEAWLRSRGAWLLSDGWAPGARAAANATPRRSPTPGAPAALVLVGDAAARVRDRRTATLVLGPGAEAAVRRYWRAAGFEVLDAGEAPPCRAVRDPVAALTPGARRVEADEDVGAVLDALDASTSKPRPSPRRTGGRPSARPCRPRGSARAAASSATLDAEAASGEAIRAAPGADDAWTLVATRAGAAPARAAVSRGGAAELTPPGGGARATPPPGPGGTPDSAADRVLAKLGFSGADVRRLDGELRARVGGGDLAARHLACGAVDEARPARRRRRHDVALCAGCAVDDVARFAAGSLVFVGGRFGDDAARLERALAAAGFHVVELGPAATTSRGAGPRRRGPRRAVGARRGARLGRPPARRAAAAARGPGAETGGRGALRRRRLRGGLPGLLADAAAGAAGDRAEALFRAGVAAAAAGENGDAADRYDAAAAMDPRHDRAHEPGALAYAASDLAAAVGFLERAVFANPGNGAALENLRVAQETAHRGAARCSRFDAVAGTVDILGSRRPGATTSRTCRRANPRRSSARATARPGRAPRRCGATSTRGAGPRAPRVLLADGDALHAAGDDASAAAAYEAALGAPRGEPALAARAEYSLGVLDQAAGRADEAEARYGRAVALDPGLAAAWNNLGILKLHGDDVEDGVRCLGEAARLDGAAYGPNRAFAARLADRSRELAAPVFAAERRVDVVTTLYAAPAPRGGELLEALGRNAALASVRTLAVVAGRRAAARAAGAKVAVVGAAGQPDYAALFAVAGDQRGPVALAHADVYFDDSLGCAADLLAKLPRPTLLAVTRRPEPRCVEASGGGHAPGLPLDLCAPQGHWAGEAVHGYDAFVFLPPAPAAVVAALAGVYQNRLGADLRVVDAFVAAGYDVLNPCLQVAAFHLHCSRQRTYAFNATVRDLARRRRLQAEPPPLPRRVRAGAARAARRAAPRRVVPRSGSSMLRRAASARRASGRGRRTTTRRSSPGATRARASAGPRYFS